jgi:hypothetical protein
VREIYLITRKGWTLSPAAEAMIETIIRETPNQVEKHRLTLLYPSKKAPSSKVRG